MKKEKEESVFYKLARPDGWDFFTGNTINYRDSIGKTVSPPHPNHSLGLCSSGVLHACRNPNECFVGASIPCSAFVVHGTPVVEESDKTKAGFTSLEIVREIAEQDLDSLFGWRYSEAINLVNPLLLPKRTPNSITEQNMSDLRIWDSVRASVWASVRASVRAYAGDSVWASIGASVGASVRDSVWVSVRDSVKDSVWDSIRDSIWAYIGSLFPDIEQWEYIKHEKGVYPFEAAVRLWKAGLVASFDGKVWRLHSGKDAEIVWEGKL